MGIALRVRVSKLREFDVSISLFCMSFQATAIISAAIESKGISLHSKLCDMPQVEVSNHHNKFDDFNKMSHYVAQSNALYSYTIHKFF